MCSPFYLKMWEGQEWIHESGYGQIKGQGKVCGGKNASAFHQGRSQQEYNERYYQELYEVMKNFRHYSVLAHLNLISRYDKQGKYPFKAVRDMVAEILKLAIADGKGIELNTSSWHYGLDDTMPARDILRLYKDLGGRIITIGSDAHSTKYLADHLEDAIAILRDEIGMREIYTFEKMEPLGHKL